MQFISTPILLYLDEQKLFLSISIENSDLWNLDWLQVILQFIQFQVTLLYIECQNFFFLFFLGYWEEVAEWCRLFFSFSFYVVVGELINLKHWGARHGWLEFLSIFCLVGWSLVGVAWFIIIILFFIFHQQQ